MYFLRDHGRSQEMKLGDRMHVGFRVYQAPDDGQSTVPLMRRFFLCRRSPCGWGGSHKMQLRTCSFWSLVSGISFSRPGWFVRLDTLLALCGWLPGDTGSNLLVGLCLPHVLRMTALNTNYLECWFAWAFIFDRARLDEWLRTTLASAMLHFLTNVQMRKFLKDWNPIHWSLIQFCQCLSRGVLFKILCKFDANALEL